jgi:hypothetical protein
MVNLKSTIPYYIWGRIKQLHSSTCYYFYNIIQLKITFLTLKSILLMKKNLSIAVLLFIGLLAFFSSCVKDTFTEGDAYSEQRKNELLKDSLAKSQLETEASLAQQQALLLDSLKKIGGVINYSVAAVVASESSWWSNYFAYWDKGEQGQMGLDGAKITIAQHGKVFVSTTDASGIGTFKDLRIGTANVNISKTGYTEVDFVVDLPPLTAEMDTVTLDVFNLVRHVATMVPVFSLTTNLSTITGKATVESDLTNDGPEVAAGVKIKGIIDVSDSNFWELYIYQPELIDMWYPKGESSTKFEYYGRIKQIAFHSTISSATTGSDGLFTMQVPSTPQGLPIDFEVDQFALDQKLLMPAIYGVPVWGLQTVRTMFGGPDFSTSYYSAISNIGVDLMNVQSAYVTFSAPTGSPAAQPTSVATATAVLTSSGIISINMTKPGEGYTQPPIVKIAKGTAFNSVQAEATAVMSGGQITGVTITSPGTGYKPGDNPTVTFVGSDSVKATYTPEFTYSVADITFSAGSGYGQTAPTVTIIGAGTGATANAVMAADIKTVDVTSPGSGYTQIPKVTISDNFKAWDGATAVMTEDNPLFSIEYKGDNTTLWPVSPVPQATVVGDGAGATASLTMSTVGKVILAGSTVAGSGYTSTPVVTISGGGGFGATAHAQMAGTTVDSVIIDDQGQGYVSIPTITISGGGGSGAGATAVLGFPVQSITMTNAGLGYNSVTTINVTNGTSTVNYNNNCVVKYNMGVRKINLTNTSGFIYSAVPTVTFTPKDANGTGAAATVTLDWKIIDVVVINPGSGYKYKTEPTIVRIDAPGGTGTQATAAARLGNGKLAALRVGSQGEGYTAAPNVYMTVAAGGIIPVKQAELTATVAGGHVTGLTIADPGEGYSLWSDTTGKYTIDISTFNPGSGAAATAHANPESGKIAYIQVDGPGSGYAITPTVEIRNDTTQYRGNANGFGTGAAATAVVTDGRVSAINITNAGSGYYIAPKVKVTVTSSVMKAIGRCVVQPDGRITGIDFTNPSGGWPGYQFTQGHGYDTAPTVTFSPSVPGKGTGATGIAVIKNGSVDYVMMTNEGSGYTGRNKPLRMYFSTTPNSSINATAGKSYVMDVYFGTGMHTVTEQGIF